MEYRNVKFVEVENAPQPILETLKTYVDLYLDSSLSGNQVAIMDSALQMETPLLRLYKGTLVRFTQNEDGIFCTIEENYVITNLKDEVVFVYPAHTIAPNLHPVNINDNCFLPYHKFGLTQIPLKELTELANIKSHVAKIEAKKEEEMKAKRLAEKAAKKQANKEEMQR